MVSKTREVGLPVRTTADLIARELNILVSNRFEYDIEWLKHVEMRPGYDTMMVTGRDNTGRFHTCSADFYCKDSASPYDEYVPAGTIVTAYYCEHWGVENVVDIVFETLSMEEHRIHRRLVRY